MDGNRGEGGEGQCRSVALKLMKPPALHAFEECFAGKVLSNDSNASHDWSIPGAELKAQLDCWCRYNLTQTMREYTCCDHNDVYPMCSVNCRTDCQSPLAQECIKACPAVCFEASDYVIDQKNCGSCDWERCWPTLDCLLHHAETLVESENVSRTCHEAEFDSAPQLEKYWQCWKDIPKHSSHWNILGAIVHCICREGMQTVAQETHCCESQLYGGGTCDVECVSEIECSSQDAQTCIHGCQLKCPAWDPAPSPQCVNECLKHDSPCRKYVSCRPPVPGGYICHDGRWPESSSGCCESNLSRIGSCPRLCESQRMWRLDKKSRTAAPWWARWPQGEGMVAQCSCHGCPDSTDSMTSTLEWTVKEDLWLNGQRMLVDIARREDLQLGPNRRMQELMLQRNEDIERALEESMAAAYTSDLDEKIYRINLNYTSVITDAARFFGDDLEVARHSPTTATSSTSSFWMTTIIVCTSLLLLSCVSVVLYLMRLKLKQHTTDITSFNGNQVVLGQPVRGEHMTCVFPKATEVKQSP